MGIPGLTGLLKRHAPRSLTRTFTHDYRGQTLAIDVSCPLNRFIYGNDPHPFPHLQGFFLLTKYCERHDIRPIFVFDGAKRLPAKQWELNRRARGHSKIKASLVFEQSRATRLAAWLQADLTLVDDTLAAHLAGTAAGSEQVSVLARLAQELRCTHQSVQDRAMYTKTVRDLSDQEYEVMETMILQRSESIQDKVEALIRENERLLVSYGKRARRITKVIKRQTYDFLTALGYPCITCENHEAEALCVNLVLHGKADAIVSEDMDTIVFGDSRLLRHFFMKNKPILQVDPMVARQQLGLTKAQFLDLCILCGTDFGPKIAGVGPTRALQLVRQHGSIEEILIHLDPRKYIPEQGFDYRRIRQVFQELPQIPLDAMTTPPADTLEGLLELYQLDPDEIDNQVDLIMHLDHKNPAGFGNDPFNSPRNRNTGPLFT